MDCIVFGGNKELDTTERFSLLLLLSRFTMSALLYDTGFPSLIT